jgi:hypothetical protein
MFITTVIGGFDRARSFVEQMKTSDFVCQIKAHYGQMRRFDVGCTSQLISNRGGRAMGSIKAILIAILVIAGIASLLMGFGVEIPHVKYKALEAWHLPAGAGLLIIAVALAYFWRPETTTKTTYYRNGIISRIAEKTTKYLNH